MTRDHGDHTGADVRTLPREALEAEVLRLRASEPLLSSSGTADRHSASNERRYRAILGSAVQIAIVATDREGLVSEWVTT